MAKEGPDPSIIVPEGPLSVVVLGFRVSLCVKVGREGRGIWRRLNNTDGGRGVTFHLCWASDFSHPHLSPRERVHF